MQVSRYWGAEDSYGLFKALRESDQKKQRSKGRTKFWTRLQDRTKRSKRWK